MEPSENALQRCLSFIGELDRRQIYRQLACVRDAIMVEAHVPGARWEVEFFPDGHVEAEVFESAGHVLNGAEAVAALERLLREDDQAEPAPHREPRPFVGQ